LGTAPQGKLEHMGIETHSDHNSMVHLQSSSGQRLGFYRDAKAISGMPSLYSESGKHTNHVPVEVDPNLHLEPRKQVRTVVQKIHFYASHSLKNPVNLFQQRMMLKYVIFVVTQVMKRCLLSVACVMMVPNTLTACQVC
jgi:hypothetical protein